MTPRVAQIVWDAGEAPADPNGRLRISVVGLTEKEKNSLVVSVEKAVESLRGSRMGPGGGTGKKE